MAKIITYEQLLKELNDLPNINKSAVIKDEKRELTNRRSYLFGFGRKQ